LELESELSFKPDPNLELELEPKSKIGTGIFEKNVQNCWLIDSSQRVSDQVVPKTQTTTFSDFQNWNLNHSFAQQLNQNQTQDSNFCGPRFILICLQDRKPEVLHKRQELLNTGLNWCWLVIDL
jgi:hypothetical protein